MTTADGRSGTTVGKYRLHEVVGRGGMGVVYRAEHVYIGREVAVKILHEGYGGREESIKRFLREARAASLINHPNIVEVTDFGKGSDGTVFFVMELLLGEPLDAILARERRLDLLRSIIICNQLTAALAAAHSKDIIHRDLKPENVMLIPREGRRELVRRVSDESGAYELSEREKQFDFVKILDFGVAKVREPDAQKGRVTKAGVVFGTPEYMAPETARIGFSDARSDIYALGIMFYEMMTGTVPFTADSAVEVMMKQVNEKVPPMREMAPEAEITEDAERMILKALAKDPEQRHQSMEEFHRDLQKCYGQIRFRRTLRTPTVHQVQTQPAATIPLTKKKKRPVTGAIPSVLVGSASSSNENEIETNGVPRQRASTPRLPGLPLNTAAPILLTKKKPQRPDLTAVAASPDEPPVSGDAITREIPKFGELARAIAGEPTAQQGREEADTASREGGDAAASPGPRRDTPTDKKKRTTLPLGLDQNSDRPTPAAFMSVVATPAVTADAGQDDGDLRDGEGQGDSDGNSDGKLSERHHKHSSGVDIGPVMISLAPPPHSEAHDIPATADRATPRVAAASSGDAGERRWLDEPTSPAVPGYPGKTG